MISINIHDVCTIKAVSYSDRRLNWIDLEISGAEAIQFTLFFSDAAMAEAYANAINAVKPAIATHNKEDIEET